MVDDASPVAILDAGVIARLSRWFATEELRGCPHCSGGQLVEDVLAGVSLCLACAVVAVDHDLLDSAE
jgi:hypothetical protein